MIAAESVTLRMGERDLLRDLSFELRPGEFVAVLGANGAGKTTLLRTIAGVRVPYEGTVTVAGSPVAALRSGDRARRIAHIASDDLFLDHLTVREVVGTGRYAHHRWWQWHEEPRDVAVIGEALDAVRMQKFAARRFDTLSTGERQRIWLALALAQEAPILLLDEPTSHLDVRVAHDILSLLREQADSGKTVVCALHDINEAAEYADRLMLLGEGRILALGDAPTVLLPELLARAYGIAMEVVTTSSGRSRVFVRPN